MSEWRRSRRRRLAAKGLAIVGYRLIAALGHTLRWRVEGLESLDQVAAAGQQPVLAFWHGRILGATYYFRRRNIVVMTSENFDGEWISGIIERFGYRTARGSTSRGAGRALAAMRRHSATGSTVGFAVDGPRGPAERVQPGALWLAKVTGNPVVPFHVEAARYWTARSWDRTQVPAPFARMALVVGAPYPVASDARDDEFEARRVTLEREMHTLRARAVALLQR